jgi:urea transport system permease protein
MKLLFPFWTKCLLLAVLAWFPQAAISGELVESAVLSALASDDNTSRVEAINTLGQLSNPGAVAILEALGNGNVLITSEGKVLILQSSDKALDPTTGESIAIPKGAEPLTLNNRLRRALQTAQASAELFAPNTAVRLAAAKRLQKEADPARATFISQALEKEQNLEIKQALQIAMASADLKNADAVVRRRAAFALAIVADAAARPLRPAARPVGTAPRAEAGWRAEAAADLGARMQRRR